MRASCTFTDLTFRGLVLATAAPELPTALRVRVDTAIAEHLAASLPAATTGKYVGTHWLASFALLALDDAGP